MKSHKPIAVLTATVLTLGAMIGFASNPAAATPPTDDTYFAAQFAAHWLTDHADPTGSFGGSAVTASVYSTTAQAALSLAASQQGEDVFDAAVDWLVDNTAAIVPTNGTASPGLIGFALQVADVAGIDPTNFGGVDLPAALAATLQSSGLYGSSDPSNDGVYRQSVAIIGLAESGVSVPGSAVDWLVDQQCGADPAAATGGWQPYRADTTVACVAPDATTYTGPDTNSTALAIRALEAVDANPDEDALAYLDSVQDPVTGGWAYISGAGIDANSTALVLLALQSVGQTANQVPWIGTNGDATSALLSLQIGCGDQTTVGAFQFDGATAGANLFATIQGIWGLAPAGVNHDDPEFFARIVFNDVCEPTNVFYKEILAVADWGLTTGYADGSFRPSDVVTRQAMAAYLYRSSNTPAFVPSGQTFSDVSPTDPFYLEIEWAADAGFINGYDDGTFRPTQGASREAVVVFLYRRTGSPSFSPTVQSFSDVPTTHSFYKEIEWAANSNIVNGYEDGTFRPTQGASRESVAAFFWRWD